MDGWDQDDDRQLALGLLEPTVADLVTGWLRAFTQLVVDGERERSTLVAYEKAARLGPMCRFARCGAGALSTREVVEMQRDLASDPERGPAIANQAVFAIRSAYAWAAREGMWDGPCPAARARKLPLRNRRFPVGQQDGRKLAAFCWTQLCVPNPRCVVSQVCAALFLVLQGTGLRRSEGAGLRHLDFDPRARTLTIAKHKTARTRGAKTIPCNTFVARVIGEIAERQWHPVWMFPSPRAAGGHICDPHRSWKRLLQHLGIPSETRIHDLRHGFAEQAYAACADLKAVQGLMWHASVATTSIYVGRPHLRTTAPISDLVAEAFMGAVEEGNDDA